MSKSFIRSRTGTETMIAAVFMIIIMLAAMALIVLTYYNSNTSMAKQLTNDSERARERIAITEIGIDGSDVSNITVSNTGTTEVTIRALYRENGVETIFLIDPFTAIPQGSSKTIDLSSLELPADPNSIFIASTQMGTKSIGVNKAQVTYEETGSRVNTTAMTIGPLMLTFDSLNWASSDRNGNNLSPWEQTWTIPTGYCAWRLNLTDIEDHGRSITINRYSGFTLSLVSSPKTTTWYLKELQQQIAFNQTTSVTFLWDSSRIYAMNATNQVGINNVFLTIYGTYQDGEQFAQTIPFEAVTVRDRP